MYRHNKGEVFTENLLTDWRKAFMIHDQYSEFLDKFTRMLEKFESLWDGHLESIRAVQEGIELHKTDSQSIDSAPYRAGPKARELKKEIDQMLSVEVIEPAQTKYESPIVFMSKRMAHSASASIIGNGMQ